jgi:hypothetical protein
VEYGALLLHLILAARTPHVKCSSGSSRSASLGLADYSHVHMLGVRYKNPSTLELESTRDHQIGSSKKTETALEVGDCHRQSIQRQSSRLLIIEFMKEVSPVLPHPCHFKNYDRSMSQFISGSMGCSRKMCADEINNEDEGQVWGELDR